MVYGFMVDTTIGTGHYKATFSPGGMTRGTESATSKVPPPENSLAKAWPIVAIAWKSDLASAIGL